MSKSQELFQQAIGAYKALRYLPPRAHPYLTRSTAMTHEAALEKLQELNLPFRNIKERLHHPYPEQHF